MSTLVMAACWPLQMPPTPKAVLVSLADNANDHGECWPSIPTIALRTCFSERAVQRAIGWLEAEGLLSADRSNGRHTRYTVTPPTLVAMPVNPRQRVTPVGKSPATLTTKPPSESREPPSEVPSNHQEPSRTVKNKEQALDLSTWPSTPNAQVLADWLDLRKRKRAPITATALRGMGAQLHRAAAIGYDVDAALTECVLRGWQGLNADWLQPNQRAGIGRASEPSKTLGAMLKIRGMTNGLADNRTAARTDEVALLGHGSDPRE